MPESYDEFRQVEGDGNRLPHLSYSRIARYLLCPEQYRLYYVEGLRPKLQPASLEFGKVIHQALAACLTTGEDPESVFAELWADFQSARLRFGYRENWENLNERGLALMRKFVDDELPRITDVEASEKPFDLTVSNLDAPLVGIIDLVAKVDGLRTVVDFKTAAQKYQDHEVALSDQLTAYHLATPNVRDYALCVMVKTKEPRIDWYHAKRDGANLVEFLRKAEYVGHAIQSGTFYKRPGKWCSYCDFQSRCTAKQTAFE